MNRIIISLLIPAFGLFYFPGHAQEPLLKHFGVEDGLPSNQVYKAIEDEAGYLLITTDRGLVRYDGYAFEVISAKNSSIIYPWYNLSQYGNKTVFFSTGLRLGYYMHGNLIVKDYYKAKEQKVLFGNRMPHIIKIALSEAGLFLNVWNEKQSANEAYQVTENHFRIIVRKPGVYFDIPRHFYYRISGNTAPDSIPVYLVRNKGKIPEVIFRLPDIASSSFLMYHHFSNGELFIVGNTLLLMNGNKQLKIVRLPNNVLSFWPLDEHHFLLGLNKGGVQEYKIANETLQAVGNRVLPNLSINDIYRDKQHNLWFSTLEAGLYKQIYTAPKFFNTGNQDVTFMVNHEDTLIIGLERGLLYYIYNGRVVKKKHISLNQKTTLDFGFVSGGQFLVGIKNQKTNETLLKKSGISLLHTSYQLLEFADSSIYGASGHSLVNINTNTGSVEQVCILPSKIFSLYRHNKRLWIGLLDGLYLFQHDTLKKINLPNQIFSDRIIGIQPLSEGKIAIASLSGQVGIYDHKNWYILEKGLNADILNDLHVLGDTLWLASNNGIFKIWLRKGHFITHHFGKSYGLPIRNIQNFALLKNNLYFAWHDKILSFNIQDIQSKHKIINKPFVTSVIINGKKEINNKNGHFKYYQNNLEINFNNIDFTEASEQTYRYRIAKISPNWQVTKERKATYLQLPPGAYTFELQVADNQGQFSTVPTFYHFEIVPAFWQTKWFPLLILGIALLLASLVFRLRLNAVNKRKQLMLELAESKVEVLALQISPHFVFNILNNVQLAIMEEDKMRAAVIISKFARLMRLLLDHSRFRVVSLAAELEWLKKYLELELIRMPEKFTYDVRLQEIAQPEKVKIPAMLIQPFIENSIKHGIGHLENKIGHIQITVKKESDKTLLFTIDDNGIGRKASEILNKNKKNESNGIEITWRRMKLLHSDAKTEFYFEIQDKTDQNNLPEGTLVIFNIPYKFSDDEP